MLKPIDFFEKNLIEPSSYDHALPNFTNAYICASISELCYENLVNAEYTDEYYKTAVISKLEQWGLTPEDASKTIFINTDKDEDSTSDTQGLIIFHNEIVFIAFRGSEKNFNDWFTNLQIIKKKSPFSDGRVHRGFLSAFNSIIKKEPDKESDNLFKKHLENIKTSKYIWLTGHSLGGALASIAASYIIKEIKPISGIYTFGSPRVGDTKYRDDLNRKLTYKYWRFIYQNDLVADIPFTTIWGLRSRFLPFGFHREGFMLQLLTNMETKLLRIVYKNGTCKVCHHYHGKKASDHSMECYRNSLLDLACKEKHLEHKQLKMELDNEIYLTDEEINKIEKNKPLI